MQAGISPATIFARSGTANRVSGFPSGLPIPLPNTAEWGTHARVNLGDIDEPGTAAETRFGYLDAVFAGEDISDALLDTILDLPVGFRLSGEKQAELQGAPLGYIVERLVKRARERGGGAANALKQIKALVLVGKFYRITTEIRNDPIPVENPYENRTSDYYTAKSATRVMQEYSFMQYPLARVHWVGHNIEGADENITSYLQGDMDLDEYLRLWGGAEGGSDVQTFMFGEGAYIAKRYGFIDGYGEQIFPASIRNSHIMRTAGLRQIILRKYEMPITFNDTYFEKITKQYHLFIPGESENCFLQSIRWFLMKQEEADFFNSLNDYFAMGAQDEIYLHTEFDDNVAKTRVDLLIYKILSALCDNGSVKEYLRKYSQGFPTIEMNRIADAFYERKGYLLKLWKKNSNGEWENLLTTKPRENRTVVLHVTLFLITDSGKILNTKEQSESAYEKYKQEGVCDGSLGHMLHCISVYPTPSFFGPVFPGGGGSNMGRARTEFSKKISAITIPLLADLYEKNRYFKEIRNEDLATYIAYQTERYKRGEVSTLIFVNANDKHIKDVSFVSAKMNSLSRKRKRWQEIQNENEGSPRIFVYAYDLETVDNLASNQDLVYPAFRKVIPNANCEPIESQIPFSAQWVGVNLSDEGKFLERKLVERIRPLDYSSYRRDEEGEYFTTDVVTDYGEHLLLGECIESFLVDIAVDVHSKGGKVAVLYATNGSKFDAYVILQFQRFEIVQMLKTSRGIMSARIRVPLTKPAIGEAYDYRDSASSSDPMISIILRDISLIVPGSLSNLCKGFDVPMKYRKLDFPIQMVNAKNCYHPRVMKACKEYGELDVYALAFVLKKINLLIGNSIWDPASHTSDKPPVYQFLTCMSMIRASTKIHFDKILPAYLHPRAIDLPVLRNWVSMAAIGGRVTSYARTYASPQLSKCLQKTTTVEELQEIHKQILASGQSMQCLDFTSLYPFVMDSCPLPMGALKHLSVEECEEHIVGVGCATCDQLKTLCPVHRYYFGLNDFSLRPFSVIIVKNVRPSRPASHTFRNFCPRKTYNTSTGKPLGLNYSMETNEEFLKRTEGKEMMLDTQAFSNIDLYWMRRQGFLFEIVGGMSWATTMVYNTFIGPAFQLRIEAKKNGNKLLSNFMKLNYNGAYGITIQQDITDSFFLANLPEEYRTICPLEPQMRDVILKHQHGHKNNVNDLLASEELTGESFYFPTGQSYIQKKKKEHLAEFYAHQSPMQVGAAILAYARHIGNLVLFNLESEFDFLYTDTDSIAISDHAIQSDAALQKLICNRDDAPLGSLKNDLSDENGTEARIIFGMFGAKKVKGYITLNAEGKLKVFTTFKGLNVSLDLNGKKIKPAYAEYKTAKALLSINQYYTSNSVEVQAWKRDLSTGVSIGNHMQKFEKETYTNFFQGILPRVERPYGLIEYIIPHGEVCRVAEGFEIAEIGDIPPPRIYDSELLENFLDDFYKGSEEEYHPGTKEYQEILDLFQSLK